MSAVLNSRWGLLSIFEYEYATKRALKRLKEFNELKFLSQVTDADVFIEEQTVPFICESLGQAKEYFRHADNSDFSVKPLLLYYAMLSIVKGLIAFEFPDFFRLPEHLNHGLTIGSSVRNNVDISLDCVTLKKSGVFQLARRATGFSELPEGFSINLHELFTRLPAVDVSYRVLYSLSEDASSCVLFANRTTESFYFDKGLWYLQLVLPEVIFQRVWDKLPQVFKDEFEPQPINPQVTHLRALQNKTRNANRAVVENVLHRYCTTDEFPINLWTLKGYEHKGEVHALSEVEVQYLLMFYLSNLARYQPHVWSDALSGKHNLAAAIFKEFIGTTEARFLMLLQRYVNLIPYVL